MMIAPGYEQYATYVQESKTETNMERRDLTDKEFDEFFASITAEQMLGFMGKMFMTVQVRRGERYHIDDLSDLQAVVEQLLYERMTGRE